MMEHWDVSTAFIHAPLKRRYGCARQVDTKSKAKRTGCICLSRLCMGQSKLHMHGSSSI